MARIAADGASMIRHLRRAAIVLSVGLALSACDRAAQPPGMDAKDLSDDRGARAGRFHPPAENGVDANAAAAADNSMTVGNNQ